MRQAINAIMLKANRKFPIKIRIIKLTFLKLDRGEHFFV
jgi:hypothetical protein